MANEIDESVGDIFNLITEHNLSIIDEVNDDFKCGICRNILINATQTICGCHFCRKCIDDYINKNGNICPGNTSECHLNDLSSVVVDYKLNKQILKLKVKCPNETCSFHCQLLAIENHLRFCPKRRVKCPFSDLGCYKIDIHSDTLNDHMQFESINHNELLIDIVGNLRNEIFELKETTRVSIIEIMVLKDDIMKKNQTIATKNESIKFISLEKEMLLSEMTNLIENFNKIIAENKNVNSKLMGNICKEVESLKLKNENAEKHIEISLNELSQKFDDINYKMNEEIKMKKEKKLRQKNKIDLKEIIITFQETIQKEIKELKMGNNQSKQEFESVKNDLFEEIRKSNDKIKLRMAMNKMEIVRENEILEKKLSDILNEIINKFQYPLIEWKITKLNDIIKNKDHVKSEYFTSLKKKYKFQLSFHINNCLGFFNKSCSIYLRIYDSPNDDFLSWPFKGEVTIKIVNKSNSKFKINSTKFLQIERPKTNLFSSSSEFKMNFNDLINAEVVENNSITIKCFINFL